MRAERGRQQVKEHQLAGVSLGGGHRSLPSGPHEEGVVGKPRHRRAPLVGYSQCGGALAPRRAQHAIDVRALARLRNPDDQGAMEIQRRVIERMNGGRGERHGNSSGDFQKVAAEGGGVVRRAASHQHNQPEALPAREAAEFLRVLALGFERPLESFGLLADFLHHQRHGRRYCSAARPIGMREFPAMRDDVAESKIHPGALLAAGC